MSRMSARFVGSKLGLSASDVYEIWEKIGLVVKDKWGWWDLTPLGRQHGGRISSGSHTPVPTFDFDVVRELMRKK